MSADSVSGEEIATLLLHTMEREPWCFSLDKDPKPIMGALPS